MNLHPDEQKLEETNAEAPEDLGNLPLNKVSEMYLRLENCQELRCHDRTRAADLKACHEMAGFSK